jgi:hypothetical protein
MVNVRSEKTQVERRDDDLEAAFSRTERPILQIICPAGGLVLVASSMSRRNR